MHQKGVSNLMKCSQCGKEFTEEELAAQNGVCPECGGKISNQKVEQTKEKASQHQETAETESEKKEKKKREGISPFAAVSTALAGSSGFGVCGIFDKGFYDAGKFGKSYQSNRACLYYR